MLEIAIFSALLSLFVYFWRQKAIKHLSVRSRDVRALYGMRQVLKLLWADENLASFDPSRDRSASVPGESRRKRIQFKQTGREAAVAALKKRLKR
jgi:hypothetical protein